MLVASEVTGLITLREMAKDSLRVCRRSRSKTVPIAVFLSHDSLFSQYSSLDPDDKDKALALYDRRWTNYVDWVLHTLDASASTT